MSEGFDEQGFEQGAEYGPGWEEAGYEPELEPIGADELRQLVYEQVTAEREQRESLAAAEQELTQLVAGHAEALGFEGADPAAVKESASAEVLEVASALLQQQGYGPDQAEPYLRDGGFALVAQVFGISPRQLAEQALAIAVQRAYVQAPTRGDESAVLEKYRRMAGPQPQGGRPSQAGGYPPWAADLVNRV